MATDAITYLPGDILVKVDRAAMSASLETRAPFLDQRVVELAWRLPLEAKIEGRTGKRILRDILSRYVPPNLQERPKQGFAIPLDRWLRGELREWAESLLCSEQIVATGVFDPRQVAGFVAGSSIEEGQCRIAPLGHTHDAVLAPSTSRAPSHRQFLRAPAPVALPSRQPRVA